VLAAADDDAMAGEFAAGMLAAMRRVAGGAEGAGVDGICVTGRSGSCPMPLEATVAAGAWPGRSWTGARPRCWRSVGGLSDASQKRQTNSLARTGRWQE